MQTGPQNRRAGRSHLVPTVTLGATALLVALGLYLFQTSPSARIEQQAREAGESAAAPEPAPSARVESLQVGRRDQRRIVEVSGVARGVREVVIGAEVGGRVIEVSALEHAPVAAGDLLVTLDTVLAEVTVERLDASVKRTQASYDLALAELGRQRDLSRGGASSSADLERADSERAVTAAQVAEAQALLKEAEATLAKLRITAPFDGIVSQLDLEPGAYLRPGDAVAELVDVSEIEIEVGLGDREIVSVADGDRVSVEIDVYPGEAFEGRVVRPGRVPDAVTQKYPVAVHLPNADERLLPGMLGTIRFELGTAEPVMHVPRRAIWREFELDYVFVLSPLPERTNHYRAQRRRVSTRLVPFRPDLREVVRGLEDGERIAVSGLDELRDGKTVLTAPDRDVVGVR